MIATAHIHELEGDERGSVSQRTDLPQSHQSASLPACTSAQRVSHAAGRTFELLSLTSNERRVGMNTSSSNNSMGLSTICSAQKHERSTQCNEFEEWDSSAVVSADEPNGNRPK